MAHAGRTRHRLIGAVLVVLAQLMASTIQPAPARAALERSAPLVRKNVAALTATEREAFVSAVLKLKTVPSPYDPRLSYYDQFVAWHISLYPCGMHHDAMRGHGGPMFLPWHRLFLLRFEGALQKVSGKPIAVPYWDWTDPSSTRSVFANDFMGGDGNPSAGYAVTTGPFRKGQWALNVDPVGIMWKASTTSYLTRRFGSFPPHPTLPTTEDVAFVSSRPHYDVAPYDFTSNPRLSFRNAMEGFWQKVGPVRVAVGSMVCGPDGAMTTTSGAGVHNLVHGWVGGLLGVGAQGPKFGTMLLPTSPNDPVFFLHHANIDRLWTDWQDAHGVDSYEPVACRGAPGCVANSRDDRMHPPFTATPADVASARALGYRYDSTPSVSGPRPRTAAVKIDVKYLCDLW